MRKYVIYLLLTVFGSLCFSHCTIQKRVYRKGWYISFHTKHHQPTESVETTSKIATQDISQLTIPEEIKQDRRVDRDTMAVSVYQEPKTATTQLPANVSAQSVHLPRTKINQHAVFVKKSFVQHKKAPSDRPKWVKNIVVFFFITAFILMIVLLVSISPTDSAYFLGLIGFFLIAFIIGIIVAMVAVNRKYKQQKNARESGIESAVIKRPATADEERAIKKELKRKTIALAVLLALILLSFFVLPILPLPPTFLLGVSLVIGVFLIVLVTEYFRRRNKPEFIEERLIEQKNVNSVSRKLSAEELDHQRKVKKKKTIASVVFLSAIMAIGILIALSISALQLFVVSIVFSSLIILVVIVDYFRWKPKDTVEEIIVEDKPTLDEDEDAKPKRSTEEQKRLDLKRNIIVGSFLAIVLAFFIFAGK